MLKFINSIKTYHAKQRLFSKEIIEKILGLIKGDPTFFYFLSSYNVGRIVLQYLLTIRGVNLKLANSITKEALCHLYGNEIECIESLREKTLEDNLDIDAFFKNVRRIFGVEKEEFYPAYKNTSSLFFLSVYKDIYKNNPTSKEFHLYGGCLSILFKLKPSITKLITPEALCTLIEKNVRIEEDTYKLDKTSALFWLTFLYGYRYRSIFRYIYEKCALKLLIKYNPNVFKDITQESLCTVVPSVHYSSGETTSLMNLTSSFNDMKGFYYRHLSFDSYPDTLSLNQQIFERLLKIDLNIANKITPEAFCACEYSNESPLYDLCRWPKGQKLLKLLVSKNPKIAYMLTESSLNVKRVETGYNIIINDTPLFWLCFWEKCVPGVFSQIIKKNKNIYNLINYKALSTNLKSVEAYKYYEFFNKDNDLRKFARRRQDFYLSNSNKLLSRIFNEYNGYKFFKEILIHNHELASSKNLLFHTMYELRYNITAVASYFKITEILPKHEQYLINAVKSLCSLKDKAQKNVDLSSFTMKQLIYFLYLFCLFLKHNRFLTCFPLDFFPEPKQKHLDESEDSTSEYRYAKLLDIINKYLKRNNSLKLLFEKVIKYYLEHKSIDKFEKDDIQALKDLYNIDLAKEKQTIDSLRNLYKKIKYVLSDEIKPLFNNYMIEFKEMETKEDTPLLLDKNYIDCNSNINSTKNDFMLGFKAEKDDFMLNSDDEKGDSMLVVYDMGKDSTLK